MTGDEGVKARGALRLHYWLSLILLLATGALGHFLLEGGETGHRSVLSGFPNNLGQWRNVGDQKLEVPVVDTLRVDEYIAREYRKGSSAVSLYIGYYRNHRNFAEIHTPENCQANSGWELLEKRERVLRTTGPGASHEIQFAEELFDKDGSRFVFLYFYKFVDDTTTSFFRYKLKVIANSLLKRRSDVAFIRVIVPVLKGDRREAVRTGDQFLEDLAPALFGTLS